MLVMLVVAGAVVVVAVGALVAAVALVAVVTAVFAAGVIDRVHSCSTQPSEEWLSSLTRLSRSSNCSYERSIFRSSN